MGLVRPLRLREGAVLEPLHQPHHVFGMAEARETCRRCRHAFALCRSYSPLGVSVLGAGFPCAPGASWIIRTAPRMRAIAAMVRAVIASCRISQPSSTATTGFT